MKSATGLSVGVCAIALCIAGSALPESLQQIAESTQRNVIVIPRDQLLNVPPARGAMEARAQSVAASQTPLTAQLQQTRPPSGFRRCLLPCSAGAGTRRCER